MSITIFSAYLCLVFAYIFIISVLTSQLKKFYKIKDNESFYSVIISIFVLIINLYLFFYFKLITISPFFALYNLISYFYYKFIKKTSNNQQKNENSGEKTYKYYEFFRKSFHFLIFGGIIAFLFITVSILNYLYIETNDSTIYALLTNFWGTNPRKPLNNYSTTSEIVPSSIFLLAFFLVSCILVVMNEAARLIDKFDFPFSKAASLFVRSKETDVFASYLYFIIGMIFSSLFLSVFPILSILATLSFGDSSYALIGKNLGKHKIPFNKIKSIEGSIGGLIITFACASIFVGFLYGIITAIIFTLIDIITPKIPMCDNLMGPVLITIGYILLSLYGFDINNIFISCFF
ncbi:MAG: hypothetical protein ACTSRP_25760 [Candidatus Helarchaeota archaeon]